MGITVPTTFTVTEFRFGVELTGGTSLGTMERQPALPQPGDVLEIFRQQVATYYEVRTRRFTDSGRVVVIVEPVK